MILDVVLLLGGIQIDQSIGIAFLQQFAEEHQFNIIVIERITSICVERILSIPVSLSYTGTMNSGFYQYITSFIVTGSIWNTCYLEYSHTLLVSASFTGITHYLYTIGFLVYLDNQSTLIFTIVYVPEYVLQL